MATRIEKTLMAKGFKIFRLVGRKVFPGIPVQIEYSLTDFGRGMIPVLYAMTEVFNEKVSRGCF